MSDSSIVHAHQFDDVEQQHEASSLGMWVFLATEVMFFGGMFLGYTIYRSMYPEAFADASNHLDIWLGTINTAMLICSSFTMALAVRTHARCAKPLVLFPILTIVLGAVFLGIKLYEVPRQKFEELLVPGAIFSFPAPFERAAEIFFSFYFAMTGMHAVHMIIGIGLLTGLIFNAGADAFRSVYYTPVELVGLVLAFRRYRMDISISVALSGGQAFTMNSDHVVSVKLYSAIFGALLVMTLATTGAAFIDLGGNLNTVVAMLIAACKALLVILFFMHVRYSSRLTWVFVSAGFFWLMILLSLTLADVLSRHWLPT